MATMKDIKKFHFNNNKYEIDPERDICKRKKNMYWKKIRIRYYPPGIAFLYRDSMAEEHIKNIDLLDFNGKTNIAALAQKLIQNDDLLTFDIYNSVEKSLENLQKHFNENLIKKKFYLHKTINTNILPLTNVSFNKTGDKCITGSYDRTCRIINTKNGTEENCLRGHDNVVFSVGFNFPICDRIITGSFDRTVKIWNPVSGSCMNTYYGHKGEIVTAEFNPINYDTFVTASMDNTSRLFHVETGQEIAVLKKHSAEVIAAKYNMDGNLLLTGSFDNSAIVWDTRTKSIVNYLKGHTAELCNCLWNFSGNIIATGSLDGTARIWDVRMLTKNDVVDDSNQNLCLHVIREHDDEVLDLAFDYTGRKLATASSDCMAKVWDMTNGDFNLLAQMAGHTEEVSKICFSPAGSLLLTASADQTARLWFTETGVCSQILLGHESDVFSCAFNYGGDIVLTASKDNTCKIWR